VYVAAAIKSKHFNHDTQETSESIKVRIILVILGKQSYKLIIIIHYNINEANSIASTDMKA